MYTHHYCKKCSDCALEMPKFMGIKDILFGFVFFLIEIIKKPKETGRATRPQHCFTLFLFLVAASRRNRKSSCSSF